MQRAIPVRVVVGVQRIRTPVRALTPEVHALKLIASCALVLRNPGR